MYYVKDQLLILLHMEKDCSCQEKNTLVTTLYSVRRSKVVVTKTWLLWHWKHHNWNKWWPKHEPEISQSHTSLANLGSLELRRNALWLPPCQHLQDQHSWTWKTSMTTHCQPLGTILGSPTCRLLINRICLRPQWLIAAPGGGIRDYRSYTDVIGARHIDVGEGGCVNFC